MPRIIPAILFFVSIAPLVFAAQPDYFPLQVGNQWTYRPTRLGQPFTIEITRSATAGENLYFVAEGFPSGTVWLRMSDDGTLYAYNPNTKIEAVWAQFGAAEGQTYNTAIDPCNKTARIVSKAAKTEIPLGQFDTALAISYPPSGCADAGLTDELYLPYVGLVQRTQTSIAGPVRYDLVYARLNYGLTILTAPEQSFSAALDGTAYAPSAQATARLTIRNTSGTPVVLTFPTSQRYEVVIRNQKGDTVYQWSRDKLFAQIFGTLQVDGEKTWVVQFPMPSEPGVYSVDLSLATQPPIYHAQLSVTVASAVK